MTKVMQIVFCFPFPSTPNWHCKIEEETLPPSFLRPLRTVSGEIRLATKERRRRIQSFFFSSDSSFLSHHKRRASELEVGGRASSSLASQTRSQAGKKKEVGAAFPSPPLPSLLIRQTNY